MVRGRVATLAQSATGSVVDLAAATRNTAAGAACFGACAPATLLTERRSRHARAASASWSTPLCATSSGWSEAAISRGFMRSGQCGDSRRLLCCDDAPHRRCRRVRHRHIRRRTRRARLLRRLGTDPAQRPQDRWRRVDEPQADDADRPDGQPVGPADSQVGWPASSSWVLAVGGTSLTLTADNAIAPVGRRGTTRSTPLRLPRRPTAMAAPGAFVALVAVMIALWDQQAHTRACRGPAWSRRCSRRLRGTTQRRSSTFTQGSNALFGGSCCPARTGCDLTTGWGSPAADDRVGPHPLVTSAALADGACRPRRQSRSTA
jgi:hypothetical protein